MLPLPAVAVLLLVAASAPLQAVTDPYFTGTVVDARTHAPGAPWE